MDLAFKYVETNPLEKEEAYPYTAKDGTCQYDKKLGVGTVSKFTDVRKHSASQLKAAVALGPVSVAVEAD